MRLEDLEARLRELLEVRLIQALPGQHSGDLLVRRLTEAIEASARAHPSGALTAPNAYTLFVRGGTDPRWHDSGMAQVLLQVIKAVASDAGLLFNSEPMLDIADDATLSAEAFRIVGSHTNEAVGPTQDMKADTDAPEAEHGSPSLPDGGFLIVDGGSEFPLTRSVINIGRRLDNDLVVEDPRVSRHHAQLRAIKGRYVLFDLDSSGGTFINGQRTSQGILHAGDVISLAGVALIYGQDPSLRQDDLGQTGPSSQAGTDRTTSTIGTRSGPNGKEP